MIRAVLIQTAVFRTVLALTALFHGLLACECQAGFILDLGTIDHPSGYSTALAINDRGDVVGYTQSARGVTSGFVYRDTVTTYLNSGGAHQELTAINSQGMAVGHTGQSGVSHLHGLDTYYSPSTSGVLWFHGINDAGSMVGGSIPGSSGVSNAFVMQNGDLQEIPKLSEGKMSVAYAINSMGSVTGVSVTDNKREHAFLFDGTHVIDLGSLSGDEGTSKGLGINRHGVVVGQSDHLAFVYEAGLMRQLPGLDETSQWSVANGINDAGEIVGTILTENGTRGFLHRDGATLDLTSLVPDSGWVILEANGINHRGQIVGTGLNPEGQRRAFLYTPHHAPEPGSLSLALVGLSGLLLHRGLLLQRRRFT